MDKKALIAIIVCGVVMLLYYPFILPLFSPKKTEPLQEEAVKKEQETEAVVESRRLPAPAAQSVSPQTDISLKEVVIENELVRMVWTNDGAALKSVKLKHFKDADAKDRLELIRDVSAGYYPLAINAILQRSNLHNLRYNVVEHGNNKIVFATSLEDGISIVKTISLPDMKYHVNMDIVIENNTSAEALLSYDIVASSMLTREGDPSADMASVIGVDMGSKRTKLLRTALKELPSRNESVGIVWGGSTNKYFSTILKPASGSLIASVNTQAFDAQGALSNENGVLGDFMVTLQTNKLRIAPGESVNHSYIYFAGPKKEDVLEQYETLDTLLSYGWLNSISKVLLAFLNAVHRAIPNYGISIIVLTIIIKGILFPLTRKSQVSMFRMQQLQPMVNQLKEKYKHDKQRMGKEQMMLFKKYGVNPMSGCLPMLLQLPVFFALFRTLQLSFEMRQAPFLFWINDLSKPDTLLYLPFSIPFIGNALNILPLIMTGASFAQMKTTPKAPAADPQAQAQQKMMSFMPIMFAFILYHMPSGLTIYWTTSTIFSIIESILIRKSLKKIKTK